MAAPRLLDKKVINAEVAVQKTQQIKEGIALAKKVDTLRETVQEESGRLETFRSQMITKIQEEIDGKIAEKQNLERGNERIRQERTELLKQLNLREELDKIEEAKISNQVWQQKLINDQVNLLSKEADNECQRKLLDKRETNIKRIEEQAERTLTAAQRKFASAEDRQIQVEQLEKHTSSALKEREDNVTLRELEFAVWDTSLQKRELENAEHDVDLSNREGALKTRYETFMRAQNYLKNKRK